MAYQSAAEAAQAVAKGETQFAVSHQSQIQETYQQGSVTVVCAFDEGPIENGPFAGVEGVGEYGYPYFRNRCFIMARAGTDEETVAELKALVILAILVVSYLLSRATDLFVVGAIFCCLGFLVYFRYNTAKNLSKHPEEFGHGSVEGVAAAESANNAVTGATLIPLLTLGIPCAMVRQDRGGGAVPEGLMAACGDWAGRKRMMRVGPRKREPPAGVCAGGWFKVS